MIQLLKKLLLQIVNQIDNGNCNMSTEELSSVCKMLKSYTEKETLFSKYSACRYLNISRATFDNYIKNGKLPKGIKKTGFKELFWIKSDLDSYIQENKT